ncbi:hypothetical protein OGATHE_001853 [Ogataea polymorpha]|uniref:Uncharacterized protein n=1 Tax=Ogataea polymorpha TaxID=460523 RepID=A0A9P8PKB6_9ASCO|nr:hypothetical protein OGATHE_001853 [Ogataea polymorpha]
MLGVASEHLLGLKLLVWGVDIPDSENGQCKVISRVSQHNSVARLELRAHLLRNVQRDWDGPDLASRKTHLVNDRSVVGLVEETGQGRKSSNEDQLEVAQLSVSQRKRLEGGSLGD